VIVDFAHNEAGTKTILEVAAGLARGADGTTGPVGVRFSIIAQPRLAL